MPELNTLFLKVGNYCRREVITCPPSEWLIDAAVTMPQYFQPGCL